MNRYGITADELHDEIIENFRYFSDHMDFGLDDILDGHEKRPLEQTLKMCLMRLIKGKRQEQPNKEIRTVGDLRDWLQWSEDEEPLTMKLDDIEYIKCVGASSTAGGRATILWFERSNRENDYQI